VRDSHDRYANLEVSYLLQRMEQFRGVAILTSNLRAVVDPAFLRRLRFVVPFPHPDPATRRELWRAALPADDRADDVDLDRLSRLDLTGGEITLVATHAGMLAAAAPVGMDHLRDAAVAELVKRERPLSQLEVWS
jgi:SpoVK/Ycf46/Vps4 family AAA+-type ATPase